jgi:hypothetical protein
MILIRVIKHLTFFHARKILDPFERAKHQYLSKAGAFVRRDAKGFIRRAKSPSKPGSPPHSHTGQLRNRIFFAEDQSTGHMLIGPEKLNQVFFDGDGQPVSGTIPEILEQPEGGDIQILEVWLEHKRKWVRADLRSKRKLAGRKTRLRRVHIESRPFMAPALKRNVDKFPDLWAGVVTD